MMLAKSGILTLLGNMSRDRTTVSSYIALGVFLAVIVVHPAVETLHLWRGEGTIGFLDSIAGALRNASSPEMLPMTVVVGVGGGVFGLLFAFLHLWIRPFGSSEIGEGVDSGGVSIQNLISAGESERIEFKSSLRWDRRRDRVNRQLELAIAKSIAGFLNHKGGYLLIGVGDNGEIIGIERDYQALSRPGWDGFERTLVNLVSARLGASVCGLIQSQKIAIRGKSICQVSVKVANTPIYCRDGNIERYYVRFGNTTRELDAHEAVDHITGR